MTEYCDETRILINSLTQSFGKMLDHALKRTCSNYIKYLENNGLKSNITYKGFDYEIEFDNEDLKRIDAYFRSRTDPQGLNVPNSEIGFNRGFWDKLIE